MFWDKPGKENTEKTVELALDKTLDKDLEHLVVASNEGDTVFKLLENEGTEDINIVCVTHHVGFREDGFDEMSKETREELTAKGVQVYTGTHVLAGIDRTLRQQYGGLYPPEIVANTLRMLGQGVKVCVEIGIMALDAGLIPYGENVMAVGGTGRGADTAAVIRPGHSNNFFETKIVEIICRPHY